MIRMTCSANSLCTFVGDPVTPTKRAFGAHGGRKRNLSGTQINRRPQTPPPDLPDANTVAGCPVRTGRSRSVLGVFLPLQAGARLAHREGGCAARLGDPVVLA